MSANRKMAGLLCLAILNAVAATIILVVSTAPLLADSHTSAYKLFFPVIAGPVTEDAASAAGLAFINEVRLKTGVPPVQSRHQLDENCFEHARYMAANNVIGHEQNPSLPYASPGGQLCAERANAWLGSGKIWMPQDSVDDWVASVGHRLWLLYPTTRAIGFGFFRFSGNGRAAAAADVLTSADFKMDLLYSGWPVKYPGEGATAVPATRYPITLNWRYGGPDPVVTNTQLQAGGRPLAHTVTTLLPAGHKGVLIMPEDNLRPDSEITIAAYGKYEGRPFQIRWQFHTGGIEEPFLSATAVAVEIR